MKAIFANSLDGLSWATDAGVAKKQLHGLTIIIETPQYELRSGKGWLSAAPADYGYIEGTTGADGDGIDCYLGPHPQSKTMYVIDQNKIGGDAFDEHKVIFGCDSAAQAKRIYLDGHTDGEKIFRGLTAMSLDKFKRWLKSGDHSKPVGAA